MKRLLSIGIFLIGISSIGWLLLQYEQLKIKEQRQAQLDRERVLERESQLVREQEAKEQETAIQAAILKIRQTCHTSAVAGAINEAKRQYAQIGGDPRTINGYLPEDYELAYQMCLRSNGLE